MSPQTLLRLAVALAALTIAMKTLAWWLTGSVGMLSDAMESFVNLASAVFALKMLAVAMRPADADHPYGHHKAEYFSSGFEGILIIGAALCIVWAAVNRLFDPQPLVQLGWGLALVTASSGLNAWLAFAMFKAAKLHHSVALDADARHLVTDVWTSAGVVVGLSAAHLTGWLWMDSAVAIGVALNILREGGTLVWRSSQGLMDESLTPDALAAIETCLAEFTRNQGGAHVVSFDHLVTRQAGQVRFANLHMHLPAHWTLGQSALLCAAAERALMAAVPGLRPTIEMLPREVDVGAPQDAPQGDLAK